MCLCVRQTIQVLQITLAIDIIDGHSFLVMMEAYHKLLPLKSKVAFYEIKITKLDSLH